MVLDQQGKKLSLSKKTNLHSPNQNWFNFNAEITTTRNTIRVRLKLKYQRDFGGKGVVVMSIRSK